MARCPRLHRSSPEERPSSLPKYMGHEFRDALDAEGVGMGRPSAHFERVSDQNEISVLLSLLAV